jgi:hypothetical protein
LYFFTTTNPIPAEKLDGRKNHVRLVVHWIEVGYTTLREGKPLVDPAPVAK